MYQRYSDLTWSFIRPYKYSLTIPDIGYIAEHELISTPHTSLPFGRLWSVFLSHDDVIKWKLFFRVTGHICGEFTGHRRIPRTKAGGAER